MFKSTIIFLTLLVPTYVTSQTTAPNIIPTDSYEEIFNPADIKLTKKDFDKRIQNLVSRVTNNLESFSITERKCDQNLLKNFSEARTKNPRGLHDEIYFLEGLTLEICGKLNDAKTSYEKSLNLRRNNPLVLYRLASILIRNKQHKEAAIIIQEAEWQGFKEKYLLTFLKGAIEITEKNYSDAINLFQQSLFLNPNFLPAAKAQYRTRTEFRDVTKDPKVRAQLDNDIPLDLARLVSLDPENMSYLFPYLRYLLSSGNILKSPMKLDEGLSLVENQLKNPKRNFSDFALLKVQFLEKLNKTGELMEYLKELEKSKKITPVLKAKKDMLMQDIDEE